MSCCFKRADALVLAPTPRLWIDSFSQLQEKGFFMTDQTPERTQAEVPTDISAKRARVIVIGNEKGGSGKSTSAIHLIVSLLQRGARVASIDLDVRQGSLSRYIENRLNYARERELSLSQPDHYRFSPDLQGDPGAGKAAEVAWFTEMMKDLPSRYDAIVIDTPGNDTTLNRLGHSYGDTLITPLNDSFIDLDVLALIDSETMEIKGPSHYAQMLWEQRIERQKRGLQPMDWVVMRNRLSHLDAHNKRQMEELLVKLAKRIGFRFIPGFGERVIFRELYPFGLTMMDLRDLPGFGDLSMSHIAARQEVRSLVEAILPA